MNGWRVGRSVPLNVYDEHGEPVCQCHTPDAARQIVSAVNELPVLRLRCQQLIDDRDVLLGRLALAEAKRLVQMSASPADGADPAQPSSFGHTGDDDVWPGDFSPE